MTNHIDDRPLVAPKGPDGNPVLQVDRLDAVVKHALNSENWNQASWMQLQETGDTSCGTTYCIAGFAAVEFAGLEPVFEKNCNWVDYVKVDGQKEFISTTASDYLGLTWKEAEYLFASRNNADDVTEIVTGIKNGEY